MSDPKSPPGSNLPGSIENVDEFSKKVLGALMNTIKCSTGLPNAGDDFDFYSSFSEFRNFNRQQSLRLLNTINAFLGHQGLRKIPLTNTNCKATGSTAIDLDDKSDHITESNDTMLEQIGSLLDEVTKASKKGATVADDVNEKTPIATSKTIVSTWNRKNSQGKQQTFRLFHKNNIARPQLKFRDKIDNSNVPFVPKIIEKPNALKALPSALIDLHRQENKGNISLAIANLVRQGRNYSLENQNIYDHPYESELRALEYPITQLVKVTPVRYEDFPDVPCDLITSKNELLSVIEHLTHCTEIAIDLEHHSYRTFQGITCLMQISSRAKDFLIDTLEMRSEMHLFNQVFTDPRIVKVFHGANSDILWLQRDFGVYVVNMFDTSQAAREMKFAHFSLDYLLQKYCGVHADKKYQLADWRVRPVPIEMRKYAQEDTHYLLYIYDLLKNELLEYRRVGDGIEQHEEETSPMMNVLNNSQTICLQKYEKHLIKFNSYLEMYEKQHKKQLNLEQLELLRLLYSWRDTMARQEDESVGYVLPKHMLFQISEIMPREAQGVLACCNPVPPLVRQHVHSIHQLVIEARAKALNKTGDSSNQKVSKVPVPAKPDTEAYEDILACPHDTSGDYGNSVRKKKSFPTVSLNEYSTFFIEHSKAKHSKGPVNKQSKMSPACSWNPFMKFFPLPGKTSTLKPASDVKESIDNLTLKTMLELEFIWKLKNLGNEEAQEEIPNRKQVQTPIETEEEIILSQIAHKAHTHKRPGEGITEDSSSHLRRKKRQKKFKKNHKIDTDFRPHQYDQSQYRVFKE